MRNFKKPSLTLFLAVFICISLIAGVVSAATMNPNIVYNANYTVANANHTVRFQDNSASTYNYFTSSQGSGGLNALHITSSTGNANGQVTNVTATNNARSGTFYLSDTGGGAWFDNGILMIAVNGTIPSNFNIQISSAGYQWAPVASGSYPYFSSANYTQGISEIFDASSFNTASSYAYGPQSWRPSTSAYYPIYDGQNVTQDMANNNTFSIIFVDLYDGIIGTNMPSQYGWTGANNNGMLQINYTINNMAPGSMVSFDAYAFCRNSPQGDGIRWTNSVNNRGNNSVSTSGYNVHNW